MIVKTKDEVKEAARKWVAQWEELGFDDEFEALEKWEEMMFKIAQGGDISLLHSIKAELAMEALKRE